MKIKIMSLNVSSYGRKQTLTHKHHKIGRHGARFSTKWHAVSVSYLHKVSIRDWMKRLQLWKMETSQTLLRMVLALRLCVQLMLWQLQRTECETCRPTAFNRCFIMCFPRKEPLLLRERETNHVRLTWECIERQRI